jgi:hypothetical protein
MIMYKLYITEMYYGCWENHRLVVHDDIYTEHSGYSGTLLFWLRFEAGNIAVYGGSLLLRYR